MKRRSLIKSGLRIGLFAFALFILSFHMEIYGQLPVIEFEKNYGGSLHEYPFSILPLGDSGYIAIGFTNSTDGDVQNNKGMEDVWLLRLNENLDTIWTRCIGGSDSDIGFEVEQSGTIGYTYCGYTKSVDGDIEDNHGEYDAFAGRITVFGDSIGIACIGGSDNDAFIDFIDLPGDEWILAGITNSTDGDVHGQHGLDDIWVVKINDQADTLWTRCYGGSDYESVKSIIQTNDDAFILGGSTRSDDGDIHGYHGDSDFYVLKISGTGDTIWTRCYGGSDNEYLYAIQKTSDDGYIMTGYTNSEDGDVHGYQGDGTDLWIIKINASGDTLWTRCYGGNENESSGLVLQTGDDGYLIGGYSDSNDRDVHGNHGLNDVWLLKLDAQGDTLWTKCFGGSDDDVLTDMQFTNDSGIVILAKSSSSDGDVSGNSGEDDIWIAKIEFPDIIISSSSSATDHSVVVYPNPTDGMLYVDQKDLRMCMLLDLNGRIIMETKENKIDLSPLPEGIYILKILDVHGKQYISRVIYFVK